MSDPPYRALRIILLGLAILSASEGALMIFGGKSLMIRAFMHPPDYEVSNLFMMMMKQTGGLLVMLGLMLYATFRDPVRNIAILNAFLVGLIILAFTPILTVYTLNLWPPYTPLGLWLKACMKLGVVGLLYWLRPKI